MYYFLALEAKGGLNSEKLCVYSEKLCGKKCGDLTAFAAWPLKNSGCLFLIPKVPLKCLQFLRW